MKNSLKMLELVIIFVLISCQNTTISKRSPASFLELESTKEKLALIISQLASGEKKYSELDSVSQNLLIKTLKEYTSESSTQRGEISRLFSQNTGLVDKMGEMSFIDEAAFKSMKESFEFLQDISPAIWHFADPTVHIERAAELMGAVAEDTTKAASGSVGTSLMTTSAEHMAEDTSVLSAVAFRRIGRTFILNRLDDVLSKPGMAIPRENASIPLFIDFIHDLEIYKLASQSDDLAPYADIIKFKLSKEFPLIARQLEGLAKTPGGLFLHIELKSALSLFLQELEDPEKIFAAVLDNIDPNLDDITKAEINSSLSSLREGVQTSKSLLQNSAHEGILKKGMRFGFGSIINTGDELSLGLHLFRHYGNEVLTRENDNIALKSARSILNTTINSTTYTGKGAAFLIEKSYQHLGAIDPSMGTTIDLVKSTAATIASPIESARDCSKWAKSFFVSE
jgi:hypothetical protein